MVSFKTDNSVSEQSTPPRHLSGVLHGSLIHSHGQSSLQHIQRQHETTLPTRHTPPTAQPTSYSTVPRSGCVIHPRLEQPVTSSTAGMDDKKVVQAGPTVASGPQVRTKSVLDGSGVGASISGLRRRNGPQPGLRSPAAKRPLSAPVALQGWLHKQGSEGLMLWKKRWFVLSEYCLFYYKGPEEEKLLGSILLPSYRVTVCKPEDKVNKKFAFKAEHANMRTYHFAADTREGMNQWVNILTLATLLQDPNPGGGDPPPAVDMAGPADGDRSARPSVSSISSILNQSADDSDSGFHGFQSRDDPSHASNNNSSPNSANTASFPNLSSSNSNSIANGNNNNNVNVNHNNTNNNNNVNSPERTLDDLQPHQPLVNGWIQPPGQFGQPGTSQQQYGQPLPGPGQQQQQQHQHQQSQYNHPQQHYQHQQQHLQQQQHQAMMHQHGQRSSHSNQQHQPGPSNVQSLSQVPRNFGQPVYANAPPKPRRLTDGSTDYSAPSPDSDFRRSPVQPTNSRQTVRSPISDYDRGNAIYASRLAQQQQPQPGLRTDKSGLNYGYSPGPSTGERRTPDGYGRNGKSRGNRVNGDYEDVYGTGPQLYQRPAGPVGYTKSPAPVPIPIPIYNQHQTNQQNSGVAVSPSNVAVMRQGRSQPPPRPHSADFLEYEATRKPNQQLANDAGSLTSSQQQQQQQRPRPQRPKSSMDVVGPGDGAPPASDGYFYSEETYAAQMRQSAVYLHQTPQHHQQQRNQSLSRATTPSKTNSVRLDTDADSNNSGSIAETPCASLRKSQRDYNHRQHPLATQSLQRYTETSSSDAMTRRSLRERSYDPNDSRDSLIHGEAGTVPRRILRDVDPSTSSAAAAAAARLHGDGPSPQNCHTVHNGPRRWSEQQFARSASARLPRTRYTNDHRDDNDYADRSPGHGSRDGERRIQQREESMKRLLEWKQRMLQSPLTRKPGSSSTNGAGGGGGSAQNELSSYYKRQALLDLAAHEATVAEARHSRRREEGGSHRPHARSKSTDGRRTAATNVSRYNSYSSDDEELGDVRRKRTRRPSHAGRSPRQFTEDIPIFDSTINPTNVTANPNFHRRTPNQMSAGHMTMSRASSIDQNPGKACQDDHRSMIVGIPPDAGYEEVSFPPIYQRDYTISVSANRPPSSTDSTNMELLRVKTPKKPSGILKTPTNYPTARPSSNESGRLSTLAGYITGDTWQTQKNVQWDGNDEKQSWDSKIDESKVIKEFSYQYIKPEDLDTKVEDLDNCPSTPEPKNLVQSRIRSFETSMDEIQPVRDSSSMQEPLKLTPPQAIEAHVSKIDSSRLNAPKIREFALGAIADHSDRSMDSKSEDNDDSARKQSPDGGKSVKDLLADFERKSQQVRRQENDRREEVKHRGVFSDTETLLYDTGSDLDQPDKSEADDDELYRTIDKQDKQDCGTLKKIEQPDDSSDNKNANISSRNKNAVVNDYDESTNSEGFARFSVTESMVTHGDDLSGEGGNLEEMNSEEHYLPMSPRKAMVDGNPEERPNPKMMESLFANLRSEESSYVEMAQNGMGNSLLVPIDSTKHHTDDYSTMETPHYEFVCVSDNKVEPVYMEVSHLSPQDDKKLAKTGKKRDSNLQVRADLPDILTALKSDSSDADDESSKDLESIDAPRHPRFSLSDTFRPASYYLGVSRTMIAELHDSSDSELVSPPPIPTSPPPMEDLDSLDLHEDAKKTSQDSQKSRNSPKSWNKPAGQVESRGSPSRFSEATISSTFRDSRISLESVSGSDSLELRNPDEEARHRQLKRRPVSDEVCEVLDSLDELESLGSRFDGASIDLDQYLEELQARDAFNVDLYAKDLSYNSIYGLNENMTVPSDKLQKTNSQDASSKMSLASSNLDQPFQQYGRRGKTSSASSLPSMRVSDTPPAHQHSQSFTGDGHYENVSGFSPLRGSPAVRLEEEQMVHEIGNHSRESSYSLAIAGASCSTATTYRRPDSAQSTSMISPACGNHQQSGVIRHHARSASQDTPRTPMSTNHRASSSQDSTFHPAMHHNRRSSPGPAYSTSQGTSQTRGNDGDQTGAPYYYSDLQVSVSNIDAQLNHRHPIGHTSRLPQLNNQRDDSVANKRNDIGRLVNPITRQIPRRIEVQDIDEARRIAAELRKSSTQYLAHAKTAMLDRKNVYEADTLRRAKSTDPLPNDGPPDVSTINIYPLGLRNKSNSQTNLAYDDVTPELEQMAPPSHRRSRSLEGLLDDVGLQNLVEQRNRANRVSSVPPMRMQPQMEESTEMAVGTSFVPISVGEDSHYGEGEDPWEQDALWRESLRRVSLRQARSLDNLDNSTRVQEASRPDSRTRTKITRGATYVNDSVAVQRQQLQDTVRERTRDDEDEGTYESLMIDQRLAQEYVWDSRNEAYGRSDIPDNGVSANDDKHFLSNGNLPPIVESGTKSNRTSTSTSGSFELDREKLRQWDLVSSACSFQEQQQRNSMAESGRGLPVADHQRVQNGGGGERSGMAGTKTGMMTTTTTVAPAAVATEAAGRGNDGGKVEGLGVDEDAVGSEVTLGRNRENGVERDDDEGADVCGSRAAASGSGSVIGRDPLPPRAVSTSQLPSAGPLTQPPSGISTLPLPRANGIPRQQQTPSLPVNQSTPKSVTRPPPTIIGGDTNNDDNHVSAVTTNVSEIRLSPASVNNDSRSPRVSSPSGSSQHMLSPARNARMVSPKDHRMSSPSDSERHLHSPNDRKTISPTSRNVERGSDGSLRHMQRVVQGRETSDFIHKRSNANIKQRNCGNSGIPGSGVTLTAEEANYVQVSAGELLGRTHEELVLLLIQLRRESTTVCKAMETCHMEIEAQAILTELDNPRRLENLQKLEELKKHLMDLEKQYEKGKPLVNLVDNMVKLGSLYNRNANNGNGSISGSRQDLLQTQDSTRDQRERIEFNQRVQEQRLLAEERRDWDRLSPDHGQLQAKVQQLYKLDRLLQEESGTLHSLQQDKDILEKALGGLRHKLQGSRSNPAEVEHYRKQQLLLERELSRVRLLLAHNSKKLEETVAENARLEQDLVVLRQKLQASRRYAGNVTRDSSGTTVALETELRRVQQLVGDLQRQRQELSHQVRQLTEKSHSLVQQIRPTTTTTSSQMQNAKKRLQSSWLETDLDSGMTQDHGMDSPSSPGPATLPRNRPNGCAGHSGHVNYSQNTIKEPSTGHHAYKDNYQGRSPVQHQHQQHQHANRQSNHLQTHSRSQPSVVDTTQNHITTALSPQLREQIQQHQLKQQLLKEQMQGKCSPVQTNSTPLYVNTESRRHEAQKRCDIGIHNGIPVPPPEYIPPPPPPCSDDSVTSNGNYSLQEDNKFPGGMHNREKQEIKTVRIVKRESERRQRDRGDRTGNIGIPVINGLLPGAPGVAKRVNDDDSNNQQFEKGQLGRVIEEPGLVHAQSNIRIADMDEMQFQRSMSLPRGFGGQRPHPVLQQGPVPPPPRSDSMNALRNIMARRHRVRFENHEGSSDSTSPYTESPTSSSQLPMSSPNYSTSPSYSPSHLNYVSPYRPSPNQHQHHQQSSNFHGNNEIQGRNLDVMSGPTSPGPMSPTMAQTAKERLFGSVASINSTNESPQLSPVFKSEAAKQIIKEMTEKRTDGPRRRQIPKEKRRHYTVSSSKPIFDLEDAFSKMGMGRARDDLDMERALRPRINAPDVVRSTLSHKELKYNESTIDQLLGTPNKIVIPERYVPEQTPELSAEEKKQRLKKADAIRKMLSETGVTASEGDDDVIHNEKSHSLKKKVAEEKRQRDHILQLNQILAKQVMEKSKMVAVKALATLPLNSEASFEDDDLSPVTPLPLYQQRENFYS